MEQLFIEASKAKYRFPTSKGASLSSEDLWDLPLLSTKNICLDDVAKTLNKEVKGSEEDSFVSESSTTNTVAKKKLEIVKVVIQFKKEELEKKKNAVAVKEQKELISRLIQSKEQEALAGKSVEELLELQKSL